MEKLKKAKEYWVLIVFFLGLIISGFMYAHNLLNKIDDVQNTISTTQQMALKSVIWNDNIPLPERASACDVYLSAGYNSLTKKECEIIVEQGTNQGIFSYVESEVKNEKSVE